jgi:hypothetical protein
MSLSLFPTEILNSICLHLPNIDLVSVATANTTLCAISQRLLYRHISIVLSPANPRVVNTLASRPDISQHVRTFSLILHGNNPAGFYHLLTSALTGMTELESLVLLIGSDNSSVLTGSTKYLHYPRLRHFTCSFAFDQDVANFLDRTPNIVELELNSATAPPSVLPHLSSTAIPHLSRFLGPSWVAELVVPGRPVQALFLSNGLLNEFVLSQLARSSYPIVLLDAISNTRLVPCLEAIARNLPSLNYLRLMTMVPCDGHPDSVCISRNAHQTTLCLF